jgi:DNA replication protein DnaC
LTTAPREGLVNRRLARKLADRPRPKVQARGLLRRPRRENAPAFSVLYKRASRLLADLAQARGEGRLPRLLGTLERTRLLIIDDWGPEPLNAEQRRDLLEIVDDRYDKSSLLITSQLPVDRWHNVIGDHTFGDAILDRVVHNAHRVTLKGDSLRRRRAISESPAT